MKLLAKLAAFAGLATLAIAPAHAQMNWDGAWMTGGEILMTDEYGNNYWADAWAENAYVDNQGNVYNDYTGTYDNSGLYYNDLTPDYSYGSGGYDSGYDSTYVPYENPADSHEAFINSIWE